MITTVTDMYKAFLDGIKKDSTAIVEPAQFNRIINDWGQDEWLKENAMAVEFNQKQIDDLDKIRCATDGEFVWEDTVSVTLFPIAPDLGVSNVFTVPKYTSTGIPNRLVDGTVSSQDYPLYLRQLNVSFKLLYGENQECGLTGVSDWLEADILRSDQRMTIFKNPFRSPKDSRLYYEMLDGKIRLITDKNSTSIGYALRLEYLRYPKQIFFDPNRTTHNDVDCEFGAQQKKEIVDIAVRTYLERVKDPRYQSFLNEEMIKAFSK